MKYAKHVDLQIVPNFVTWPFRMLVRDFETKGGNYYRAGKGVECFWNVSCACPFEKCGLVLLAAHFSTWTDRRILKASISSESRGNLSWVKRRRQEFFDRKQGRSPGTPDRWVDFAEIRYIGQGVLQLKAAW